MMGALEKVLEQVTIAAIAREALSEANGNIDKAAALFVARVQGDELLLLSLATQYVESIQDHKRTERRTAIYKAVNYDPGGNGHRVLALATGNARMLLDWPLQSGKPLRKATKEEVRADAESLYAQGSTMVHRSRWLALIAAKTPNGKTVGDVLDEKVLHDLMGKAKRESK